MVVVPRKWIEIEDSAFRVQYTWLVYIHAITSTAQCTLNWSKVGARVIKLSFVRIRLFDHIIIPASWHMIMHHYRSWHGLIRPLSHHWAMRKHIWCAFSLSHVNWICRLPVVTNPNAIASGYVTAFRRLGRLHPIFSSELSATLNNKYVHSLE